MPEPIDLRGRLPTRVGARPYYLRAWTADPYGPTEEERREALAQILAVTLHYTASSPYGTVESIAAYQTGPGPADPFPAIAYTLVVTRDGTAYLCHDLETRCWHNGAVVDGVARNVSHIGVAFIGMDTPTLAQRRGMGEAIAWCERELGRALEIEGHKDAYQTLCPGFTWPEWKPDVVGVVEHYRP